MIFLAAIWKSIKTLFSSWKAIVALLLVIALALAFFKIRSVYSELEATKTSLKTAVEVNVHLNSEIDEAKRANQQNEVIILQLQSDKKLTLASVRALADKLKISSKDFSDLKSTIDARKPEDSTPVPSVIADTIDQIQKFRGAAK